MTDLRHTALYDTHISLGGRIVPFGGWAMPIQYTSILQEARAVRNNAGLFDVSHMGRLDISGGGAASLLNRALSVNAAALRIGRARYNVICNASGGIIDDCIVYRRGDERFLLIPNAANTAAVLDWLDRLTTQSDDVDIRNITADTAMIAHQGPQAAAMLSGVASRDLASVRPFAAVEARIDGVEALLARTGYTGEDGFEIILPAADAPRIWRLLMDKGAAACGLGARDVLRLEAGLLLHGNDMDAQTNPYEAGLDRFVDPDREGYAARDALLKARDEGVDRVLVGFTMAGRGIPRHGYAISDGERNIGIVTSGGPSPTLDNAIGLGYVPACHSAIGSTLKIDIRGRLVEAQVARLPFYSRRKA